MGVSGCRHGSAVGAASLEERERRGLFLQRGPRESPAAHLVFPVGKQDAPVFSGAPTRAQKVFPERVPPCGVPPGGLLEGTAHTSECPSPVTVRLPHWVWKPRPPPPSVTSGK